MNRYKTVEELTLELIREREKLLIKQITCQHTKLIPWKKRGKVGAECDYCGEVFVLQPPKKKAQTAASGLPKVMMTWKG